jgi:hypothetical protein
MRNENYSDAFSSYSQKLKKKKHIFSWGSKADTHMLLKSIAVVLNRVAVALWVTSCGSHQWSGASGQSKCKCQLLISEFLSHIWKWLKKRTNNCLLPLCLNLFYKSEASGHKWLESWIQVPITNWLALGKWQTSPPSSFSSPQEGSLLIPLSWQ